MSRGGKRKDAGRPPLPEPRIVRVNLHLSEREAATIDHARGPVSRAEFVRESALVRAVWMAAKPAEPPATPAPVPRTTFHKVPGRCPNCFKYGTYFMVEDDDGNDTDEYACADCGWCVVVTSKPSGAKDEPAREGGEEE